MESPYIGAYPDGDVYDSLSEWQEYGFLEIKCTYTHRDMRIFRGHDNKPSFRNIHYYYAAS